MTLVDIRSTIQLPNNGKCVNTPFLLRFKSVKSTSIWKRCRSILQRGIWIRTVRYLIIEYLEKIYDKFTYSTNNQRRNKDTFMSSESLLSAVIPSPRCRSKYSMLFSNVPLLPCDTSPVRASNNTAQYSHNTISGLISVLSYVTW